MRDSEQLDLSGSVDQLSDQDLLVRMLYFCDQPRTHSQIMTYCSMDRMKLERFTDHCISKNLLKRIHSSSNDVMYTLTQHGNETLYTAIDIMRELQIDTAGIIAPKKR